MIGVSTAWRSRSFENGADIVTAIARIGAKAVELDYRLTLRQVQQALVECEKIGLSPLSVHAVCPSPESKGDWRSSFTYPLHTDDDQIRKKSVAEISECIRFASGIGARAVVIHAGTVPMEKATLQLQALYDQGKIENDTAKQELNRFRIERLAKRGASFDKLLQSLDELNEVAIANRIDIGIENRYYLREYPNFEELAIIFLTMSGGRLKYWHDTGHAQVQGNLGITPHRKMLEEFSRHLIGVHLHDVDGYTDHLAPPSGGKQSVDFNMVNSFLKPDTIRVLEFGDLVTEEDAAKAVAWAGSQLKAELV